MKIVKVICSKGRTGFFFDDQRAIKGGAKSDGSAYIGEPVTAGFTAVRQAGEAISVMLVLEDGQVFQGFRFGADGDVIGELVFSTNVCGYVETLTDPGFAGQIVMQTYPLIGNYGMMEEVVKKLNI